MGYGQQIMQSPQLQDLLAQQQMQMQRQQSAQQLMQGNGSLGGAGILAAALGGYMNKKKGDQLAQGDADIQTQIAQMQQQAQQDIEAKKYAQADAEYQSKLKALVASGIPPEQATLVAKGIAKYNDFKEEKQKPTTLMQNLSNPETRAYLEAGQNKSGITINNNPDGSPEIQTGKIPDGFALTRDPQTGKPTLQRIEGSEQLEEKESSIKTQQRKIEGLFADFNNIDDVLDKTIGQVGYNTAGIGGQIMSNFGGTEATDLQENLKTVQADAAFSSLQQMRDNSKTGGALGQVSERELGLLSSAKAALNQSQSPEQLRENLQRYKKVRAQAMQRVAEAYKQDYGNYPKGFGGGQESAPQAQQPQASPQVQQMSDEDLMRALQGG